MFLEIFRGLNSARVEYLVVGGVAVNIHGVERLTGDLDLLLDEGQKNLNRFWDAMASMRFNCRVPVSRDQFCEAKNWKIWTREKGAKVITFIGAQDALKQVDVLISSPVKFPPARRRRIQVPVEGEPVPVMGISDLIKMKTKAGRPKDRLDIAELKRLRSKRKIR